MAVIFSFFNFWFYKSFVKPYATKVRCPSPFHSDNTAKLPHISVIRSDKSCIGGNSIVFTGIPTLFLINIFAKTALFL